jgi:hypothetical protein
VTAQRTAAASRSHLGSGRNRRTPRDTFHWVTGWERPNARHAMPRSLSVALRCRPHFFLLPSRFSAPRPPIAHLEPAPRRQPAPSRPCLMSGFRSEPAATLREHDGFQANVPRARHVCRRRSPVHPSAHVGRRWADRGVLFVVWPLQYRSSMRRIRERIVERGGDMGRFETTMDRRWIRVALRGSPCWGCC